jgi:octaprenyl-diphosphate synthase
MHDDVIDDGHERRGVATVNHKVGNAAAVLGGDLLLTSGLRELASEPPGVTQLALAVVDAMTWSAIAEVRARGRSDLSLDAWRSIAEGKTGALFSWCGEAPAFLANDDDAFARFSRCGRHFGVAFQLADDVLDLLGDSGKDRFADVKNKNPSYPLLFAREAAPQVFSRIEELWAGPEISSDDVASLGNELLAAGIAQATLEALQAEVAAGIDALGRYAEKPGGADIARWATDLASVHGKANGSA